MDWHSGKLCSAPCLHPGRRTLLCELSIWLSNTGWLRATIWLHLRKGHFKHYRQWGGQAPREASRPANRGRQPDVHPGRFKMKGDGWVPLHLTSLRRSVRPYVQLSVSPDTPSFSSCLPSPSSSLLPSPSLTHGPPHPAWPFSLSSLLPCLSLFAVSPRSFLPLLRFSLPPLSHLRVISTHLFLLPACQYPRTKNK